jgi:hypothetical protein
MRLGTTAPVFLLASLIPISVAHAQAEVQGSVAASTGWTDNYNASAGGGDDSIFTSIEPGVQALFASPEALISASISHITTDTASPVATDPAGGINALPEGPNQFIGFNLGAGLSHQISDLWRTTQGVAATYTTPFEDFEFKSGATFNGNAAIGLDRDLERGNAGLNLGATYNFIEGLGAMALPGTPVEDQKQVLFNGALRYTRPLAPSWTLDLAGGATSAADADDLGNLKWYPIGNATVAFQEDKQSASLSYNRGVTLNPFLRQTIIADDVVVRAGLPLRDSRWLIGGAIGYQHASTVTFDPAVPAATLNVFSLDASVAYEISPTMNLGGRYQLAVQESDAETVPDLVRNSISIVFTAKYPDRTRTVVPFRQPLKMLRDPTLGEPERPRGRAF